MNIKLKPTEFRAKVNDINQVTVNFEIRRSYGINPQDEIILEYKGKIDKKETIIKPKEILVKKIGDKQNE